MFWIIHKGSKRHHFEISECWWRIHSWLGQIQIHYQLPKVLVRNGMWSYTFDTIIRSKYFDWLHKVKIGCGTVVHRNHSNSGSIHLAWCNHRLKQTRQRCYGMAWPFIQRQPPYIHKWIPSLPIPVQSCFPFDCGAQSLPCLATQSTVLVIVHHSHNDHITEIFWFFPCGCYNTLKRPSQNSTNVFGMKLWFTNSYTMANQ